MRHYVIVTNWGQVEEYDADNIEEVLKIFREFAHEMDRAVSVLEVNR